MFQTETEFESKDGVMQKEIEIDEVEGKSHQDQKLEEQQPIAWTWTLLFFALWPILFYGVVYRLFHTLPEGLKIKNEHLHGDRFIAERAQIILRKYEAIGPKVVGSFANENRTVELLSNEVAKIRQVMHHDLFDLEIDLQQVSGAFIHWEMVNQYQGLQNFVVKLSCKNSHDNAYLLINSHFDSKPGSPGSGDDGSMLVVMLETLRVIATSRITFKHPIVFLFNGAEENPLQASHGFITQHKWAKKCKAVINLESAGAKHKEILFQSGPNNPWLLKYYKKAAAHTYATTIAEEIFQSNIIPSDSDFRNFRDHGHIPGLDFATTFGGYVYHTKFDQMNTIPLGTLQNTGDNILSLARAFANAPELEDPSKYAGGHSVFYDFLGLYLVLYTEAQGETINRSVAVCAVIIIAFLIWKLSKKANLSFHNVLVKFAITFVLQIIGIALALGLPLGLAVALDTAGLAMSWFTLRWMVIGLYICPALFGLSVPTTIYLSFIKNDKLPRDYRTQMIMHAHCLILAIAALGLTYIKIRTSYLFMLAILSYFSTMLFNIIANSRQYWLIILTIIGQIVPFMYITYLLYTLLVTIIPMMGRLGSAINPDLIVGGLCAMATVLALGFVIPLINTFQKPMISLIFLLSIAAAFVAIANSPYGFPYRPKTNVQRINFMHVRRIFYEADKTVSKNESGYYFDFQDRRMERPLESTFDISRIESIADDCYKYMMCGIPLFNHRWYKARFQGKWLPVDEYATLPGVPTLELVMKTPNYNTSTIRYDFRLSGPAHMGIFIGPYPGVKINDWSFLKTMLVSKWKSPYFIYFTYGNDRSPLNFFVEFKLKNKYSNSTKVGFEVGISGHYVSSEHNRSVINQAFIGSFPQFSYVMEWPSSYERYVFEF